MTLLFLDGAEDGLSGLGKYWIGSSAVVTSPVRTAGGKAGHSLANPEWRALPADEHATFFIGMALYWNTTSSVNILEFKSDAGASIHLRLYLMSSGQLQVRRGDGTVLGTSAMAAPITPFTYHHYECMATLHDSTGSVYVRVDEVQVLALTGIDTKNGGTKTVFDQMRINVDQGCYWDDVYICNGAGGDTFRGDCIVVTSLPTNNGNSSVLVGSDGNSVNNYALVNEAAPDTTSYVGSATTGDKDTYAFADLSYSSGTVKGVIATLYAAKSDAGARSMRVVTRSSGTDYGGSDKALSTTYTTYREVLEVDPATSAAWTIAGFNAAEFGMEVRS